MVLVTIISWLDGNDVELKFNVAGETFRPAANPSWGINRTKVVAQIMINLENLIIDLIFKC